ncbi:hypothetical protein D3C87_301250 [compost metagenome]
MENTVLILGAGFSKPYGYPTGPELVENLIQVCGNSRSTKENNFAKDLENFGSYSIDKFLSIHKNHGDIGISKIAHEILRAEEESLSTRPPFEDDIIKLLLNDIEVSDFEKIRIVSFNYDRLLEWKFLKKLGTTTPPREAYKEFQALKIEHIHGRMPYMKDLEFPGESSFEISYALSGASREHKEWARTEINTYGINSFKTIYSADDQPNKFAVDALKWARRVFFLGFAFDKLNMAKLGINNESIIYDWESKYVAGSAYNLQQVRKNEIEYEYPFLKGRLFNLSAKNLLVQKFHLKDAKFDSEPSPKYKKKSCCQVHATQERSEAQSNLIQYVRKMTCSFCQKSLTAYYEKPTGSGKWLVRTS